MTRMRRGDVGKGSSPEGGVLTVLCALALLVMVSISCVASRSLSLCSVLVMPSSCSSSDSVSFYNKHASHHS